MYWQKCLKSQKLGGSLGGNYHYKSSCRSLQHLHCEHIDIYEENTLQGIFLSPYILKLQTKIRSEGFPNSEF